MRKQRVAFRRELDKTLLDRRRGEIKMARRAGLFRGLALGRGDIVLLAKFAQGGGQGRAVQGILDAFETFGLQGLLDLADSAAAAAARQFIGAFKGRGTMV